MFKNLVMAATALAAVSAAGPARAETVYDAIAGQPGLSQFAGIVERAGLRERLSQPGVLHVYAPQNSAFEGLPHARRQQLLGGATREDLQRFVLSRITQDRHPLILDGGWNRREERSLAGTVVRVEREPGQQGENNEPTRVTANGALVISDVRASNGHVYLLTTAWE